MKKVILSICLIMLTCLVSFGCGGNNGVNGNSSENGSLGSEEQSHLHTYTIVTQKPSTCATKGNIEHYSCSCGKLFDLDKNEITVIETELDKDNHESTVYLQVKTQPQKLLYNQGESFDKTGLVVVKKCDHCEGKVVDNQLISILYQTESANSFKNGDTKVTLEIDGLTIDIEISLNAVYTVTFDTQGGTSVDSVQVVEGGKIPVVEVPTKSNEEGEYEFVCWLYNGEEWDFETGVVTENMVLVAKWKKTSSYTPPYVPKD